MLLPATGYGCHGAKIHAGIPHRLEQQIQRLRPHERETVHDPIGMLDDPVNNAVGSGKVCVEIHRFFELNYTALDIDDHSCHRLSAGVNSEKFAHYRSLT